MATEGGTYLPPVVATLVGDADNFAKTLIEAKLILEEFSDTETVAHIGLELAPITSLVPQLALIRSTIQTNLRAAGEIPLQFVELSRLWAEKAGIDAVLKANFQEAGMIPLHIDFTPLLTGTIEAETIIDAEWREIGDSAGATGGRSAAFAWMRSFLTWMMAFNLGKTISGLPGALGMGKGGMGIPGMGWTASFGSVAGLMGLGVERILTTLLGLVGSFAMAMAGLGVIAAGTFATMAVGMGSDMLVMKTALSQTSSLYTLYTNLQNAVKQYGAGSQQAADAQQALNNQLLLFGNNAATAAEMGLAKLVFQLKNQWNQATIMARVQAVSLMTSIVLLGQTYVPLVAEAARRNLTIINSALVPLFAWLRGPQGMGIFHDLENKFARDLPTAMHAFSQAVEFLLRFLDLASNYTGGFVKALDRLFTYLNSASGFARVERDVAKVVGVFKIWEAFIIILGKDLGLLLGQTVGVGTSIVQSLTGMLTKLHEYLSSTSGKSAINSLFEAHKNEIMALLQLLPKLAGPVAELYIKLAVPLTNIATAVLNTVNALISIPGVGPIIAWGLAALLLASRIGLISLAMAILKIRIGEATVAQLILTAAMDANPIGLIILAIAALIVIIILVITHWKQVSSTVQAVWKDVTHFVGQIVTDVGKFFSALGTMVEKTWATFAARPGYWIGYLIGWLVGTFIRLQMNFAVWFANIVLAVWNWGKNMAAATPGALKSFLSSVFNEINKLPGQVWSIGVSIATGLWHGLQSMGPWLLTQISGFLAGLVTGAVKAIKGGSPSMVFAEVGKMIPQGVALGVKTDSAVALSALVSMFNQMSSLSASMGRGGAGRFSPALAGAGGRGPISISAPISVTVPPGSGSNPQAIGSAVQRAISDEFSRLVTSLQGGIYSTPGS